MYIPQRDDLEMVVRIERGVLEMVVRIERGVLEMIFQSCVLYPVLPHLVKVCDS
jgi:hypothetical protein